MKKYILSVNGTSYEVELEEVKDTKGDTGSSPSISAPKPAPVQKSAPAPKPIPAAKESVKKSTVKASPSGAETIEAPMPGTILDVKVNEGDVVKEGQVLFILEAMKMENEIVAPVDGKVVSINTSKGAAVNAGDALISIQ
jgi:glutaconyl-CoA/methylmalonyl-CoA decarboxylase subunit gamma